MFDLRKLEDNQKKHLRVVDYKLFGDVVVLSCCEPPNKFNTEFLASDEPRVISFFEMAISFPEPPTIDIMNYDFMENKLVLMMNYDKTLIIDLEKEDKDGA